MINEIIKAFPQAKSCYDKIPSSHSFGINDDVVGHPCRIEWNTSEPWHFTVINDSRTALTFLKIDNCVFASTNPISRCDFAMFNSSDFCFVEIKDTVSRESPRIPKAIKQLETTIQEFLTRIDFSRYNLEAFVSFRNIPARPSASAVLQSARVRFFDKYKTKLFDNNKKHF